jgi:hypothetical protein
MTNTEYSPTCTYIGTDYNRLQPICCNTSIANKSYCEEHVWIVYQQGSSLARRRKDIRRAHSISEIVSDLNDVYAELIADGEVEEA